jgi:hypothetical protein
VEENGASVGWKKMERRVVVDHDGLEDGLKTWSKGSMQRGDPNGEGTQL